MVVLFRALPLLSLYQVAVISKTDILLVRNVRIELVNGAIFGDILGIDVSGYAHDSGNDLITRYTAYSWN